MLAHQCHNTRGDENATGIALHLVPAPQSIRLDFDRVPATKRFIGTGQNDSGAISSSNTVLPVAFTQLKIPSAGFVDINHDASVLAFLDLEAVLL